MTEFRISTYNKTMEELWEAIRGYKSEWENPVSCPVMKATHRKKIFSCYEKIILMGDTKKGV